MLYHSHCTVKSLLRGTIVPKQSLGLPRPDRSGLAMTFALVSLRGAQIQRGDEAIPVDLAGNEIATHLSGARNDGEGRARHDNPYYVIARLT
jgi:hypothetical protein